MAHLAVIFNGLHFAQAVADKAIAYAMQTNSNIIALFLMAKKQSGIGYGFSGDLTAAGSITERENDGADDRQIIDSNKRFLEHTAQMQQVHLNSLVLQDPSREAVGNFLVNCDRIFIQGHDEHGVDTPMGVDIKTLLADAEAPIEIVP